MCGKSECVRLGMEERTLSWRRWGEGRVEREVRM